VEDPSVRLAKLLPDELHEGYCTICLHRLEVRSIIHKYLLGVLSACSPQIGSSGPLLIRILFAFYCASNIPSGSLMTPFPTDEDPMGDPRDYYWIGGTALGRGQHCNSHYWAHPIGSSPLPRAEALRQRRRLKCGDSSAVTMLWRTPRHTKLHYVVREFWALICSHNIICRGFANSSLSYTLVQRRFN
jgi:hypothetical protein